MVCLGNEQRSFCHFWYCTQVLHFRLFVDYDCCSMSSQGFLPIVIDIKFFWVKFNQFKSILVHWFLKCQCLLLPSPVWPLPICLDSWTNIPGSYAILLFTASDFTSISSHIHNWVLILLWLCLCILSGVSFHRSPVAYWAPTNLGSASFSVLSLCLFILFMGSSRQEFWSGLPFPSPVDHIVSDLSAMTRPSWVA